MNSEKTIQNASAVAVRVSSSSTEYEGVRTELARAFERSYTGWSTAIDRHFDERATFLTLTSEERLVGGIRIITRHSQHPHNPLPFEIGESNSDLTAARQISVEYSGLWAAQPGYSITLAMLAAQWLANTQPQALAAAVYPTRNQLLRRLYIDSLGLAPVREICLQYAGVTHQSTAQPVDWSLAIDLPGTRLQRLQKLSERPYVRRILDRCVFESATGNLCGVGDHYHASGPGK
ncbi:MAG: hypothetical protein NXI04_06460 [Planctomycetaceae bacterium]|nr:hypothetical protein [Planctomycetaceae bacterium]